MTVVACRRPGGLQLTGRLLAEARLPAGAAVLDVGCGAGATVAHLTDEYGCRAAGVDASAARIAEALAARPELDFVAGRAERLPFSDASFDAALCECVLSTLAEPAAALREMARVLRPGGVALLSDVYVRAGDRIVRDGGIPALGSRETIERLLDASGLHSDLWRDESGSLARYIWDLAAPGGSDLRFVPPPSERRAPRAHARQLGYFICAARVGRAATGS